MTTWIEETDTERKVAVREKLSVLKQAEVQKRYAATRLQKWTMEVLLRREAENELAKANRELRALQYELQIVNRLVSESKSNVRQMRKEWPDVTSDGRRSKKGGSRRWPIWVVQVICELLINGTPPPSIPNNI